LAVRRFADWVLDPAGLGFSQAFATCATANPASGAVARAAGFEATSRPAPAGQVAWRRVAPPVPPGTLHP
jgi:hypothetical protein